MVYIFLSVVILVLDQAAKYLVRKLPMDFTYNVIGEFLRIVHVENSGAAFGMFSGSRRFLLILPVIVIAAAVVVIARQKGTDIADILEKVSLTLIVSGGIGNLIDRMIFGTVTDMISFSIFPPVFNVADIAVTCGCGLLIICIIMNWRKEGSE